MTAFVRLLRVLRRGPQPRRMQAMLGLALLVFSLTWMALNLATVVVFFAAVLLGVYFVVRSLRDSPPSSSSSS